MDKYDYFYIDWIISSIYLELLNSPPTPYIFLFMAFEGLFTASR